MAKESEEDDDLLPITLVDGELWIADPDLLHPESGCEDVLAVQYMGGQLWILDGKTRTWIDVAVGKPRPGLKSIK